MRKISPPPGFDIRTVQTLASSYTDYATRPHIFCESPKVKRLWVIGKYSLFRIRNLILKCSNCFCYNWRHCNFRLSSKSTIPAAQQFSSKEISKFFLSRTLGWKRQAGLHIHLTLPLWTSFSGVTYRIKRIKHLTLTPCVREQSIEVVTPDMLTHTRTASCAAWCTQSHIDIF